MAGFKWAYSLSNPAPVPRKYPVKDTVVLTRNMMVNLESGEIDKGATGDTALLGTVQADVDNTDDGEYGWVIIDPKAVYEVEDANIRLAGATLDLGTDALSLAASNNVEFIVIENSAADEPTRVMIHTAHAFKGS